MGSPLCDHLARLCHWILQFKTVNNHDHSRIPLCTNCVSETAVIQCLDQGLCLCQTCVLNPNYITSRFFLLRNRFNNSSAYYPLDLDLDSSSSSSSSSLFNRNWAISFASFPLYNEDSSSSFEIFENYRKNSSDQQVPMLQPHYLHTPKDSSCLGFNGYDTKEDTENVLLNTFDWDEVVLDQKEYTSKEDLILTDQLIDEITKTTRTEILSSSSSGMSSVIHKDYNIEALANASCQDYYKHQMIGSKGKEETNNFGIFSNALVQLDCGLTDEMLPREKQKSFKRSNLQDREEAKKRYFAKKTKRKFGKQIRYESRKSTADTKRRMKGRFTKAGAEYDYDPRANNNNKGTNKIMS